MKKSQTIQHVQVPHLTEKDEEITPKDQLIYACIRRHMNSQKLAYPSLTTIAKESGASQPTVSKSIKILKNHNYFSIIKKPNPKTGKISNFYLINTEKCKNFEMFSYEFLDKEDLSFNEKAYILASQQFMFKENGLGKISYTNEELGELIHVSERTIKRYNHNLIKTPYLKIISEAYNKDVDVDGNYKQIKCFNLPALGKALVCAAIDHEIRISDNEEDIKTLKQENAQMKKDIEMLRKALFEKQTKQIILENPKINSESKDPESSYSVEGETN